MRDLWPVAIAVAVRLGVWLVVSPERLASDEDSYVRAGLTLLSTGQQDLFWPPGTGWLVAAVAWMFQTTNIRWLRLAWIALDVACLFAVRGLARRVAPTVANGDGSRESRFVTLVTLAYALYLPAISFSQFVTSEIPALLLTLLALVLLTRPVQSAPTYVGAGMVTGLLAVTRPSLLPLVVFLPAVTLLRNRTRPAIQRAAVFIASAAIVVAGVVARNYATAGELTIAQNSAYNLYIGNRDLYAEDLDLFHPVATAGQIEFRRQFFAGELTYPTETPQQLQREAMTWIAAHPGVFARRALGRLARVFAPKTDVLELVGGERAAGVFSARSLTMLTIANLQWVVALAAGLVGLAALRRLRPDIGGLFLATLLGSLPLCLIAISKPRYAFGFEPLLIIGAVAAFVASERIRAALTATDRWVLGGCAVFLLWGWAAWVIFAVTSRVALANAS